MRLNDLGNCWNPGYNSRGEAKFAQYFQDEVERLACLSIERLKTYIGQPKLMAPLRRQARWTAEIMFAAEPAGAFLDALYDRVALERTKELVQLDPAHDASSPEALPLEPDKQKISPRHGGTPAASLSVLPPRMAWRA
ncbi:MAG: hypothetical protein EOR57_02205 [Mesorhizobium sp.]|nr:hypothetical protein [Mesorhizobium sp.]RWL22907.1 MAG: hypothetical protein EOR57_02205 [Mesorhizobium sp.]